MRLPRQSARLVFLGACLSGSLAACGGGDGGTQPPPPAANQPPSARFTASPDRGNAPLDVELDGSGSTDPDGQVATWAWSFGDGATGSGERTRHTYAAPGQFVVRLIVQDARGAADTATGTVTVDSPPGSGAATLQGTVWHDLDGDGVRDGGEPGSAGRTVFLDADADGSRDPGEATTVTGTDGTYAFTGLDESVPHVVALEMTLGWTPTFSGPAPVVPLQAARIIGGTDTDIATHPFQVSLRMDLGGGIVGLCGGSLIASTWVMTAAHCVDELVAADVTVRVGSTLYNAGGTVANVVRVRIYPAYGQSETFDSDLALLELDRPFLVRRIWPDDGTEPALSAPGVVGTIVGWGLTLAGGSVSQVLQEAPLPVISNQQCGQAFQGLTDGMICGAPTLGTGSCQGDSGGPFFVQEGVRQVAIGITSFGLRCAAQPGVYARVSSLYSYIASVVAAEPNPTVTVDFSGGTLLRSVDFGTFR
ncbi:MAG: trypsin-like serine protease [Gemmatimonadetes bacterium]|nr:trypsin-like serine protease [Gemmatimonadota bacterium]